MPDPETPSISETLRGLIAKESRTLKEISTESDVPYQILQKWVKGETAKLDVGIAEKVYQTLTGKTFDNGN